LIVKYDTFVRVLRVRTYVEILTYSDVKPSGSCMLDDWLASILWPRQRELCHELGVARDGKGGWIERGGRAIVTCQ